MSTKDKGNGSPRASILGVAGVATLLICACSQTVPAQEMGLRWLGSSATLWLNTDNFMPNPADPGARVLLFNAPPGFPTHFAGETNVTEFWGAFNYPDWTNFPDGPIFKNDWPALTNSFSTASTCGTDITNDFVGAWSTVRIDDLVWPMPAQSSPLDAVQMALDWWTTVTLLPSENFQPEEFDLTFNVTGGGFDGKTVRLPAAVAVGSVLPPGGDAHNQHAFGDLFLAVDWGVDLYTNRQFLIFHISMEAYASGGRLCLSLPTLCQQWLASPGALPFVQNSLNNIQQQLLSGDAYIQGAVPELLFLYDFSCEHSRSPSKLLPSLNPNALLADYGLLNQYDAGPEWGLPIASDGRRGGNACGVMSLTTAMNSAGLLEFDVAQVYANTMTLGRSTNFASNEFNWLRARAWLQGEIEFNHVPFPNPLNFGAAVDYLESRFLRAQAWNAIDGLLARKQPVLIRTDLGVGAGIGTGHVILLLGKGNSSHISDLYGTGGDYYVVGDPAGHFFADTHHTHYGTVENLQTQYSAINHAGFFAMYPVELLRNHVNWRADKDSAYIPIVRAMTIGAPFSAGFEVQVQCPVTITVTDPTGNQTGILTNGAVLEQIPQSVYEPAATDSEDGSSIDPDGPKTIRVDNPMAGTYRVDITGTNSGPFTLLSHQFDISGANLGTNMFTGTTALGQRDTYFITVQPNGPPPLLVSQQAGAVVLSWTTNYVGFNLETTTNPVDGNSWTALSGVVVDGGFNITTNPIASGSRFFRLKK